MPRTEYSILGVVLSTLINSYWLHDMFLHIQPRITAFVLPHAIIKSLLVCSPLPSTGISWHCCFPGAPLSFSTYGACVSFCPLCCVTLLWVESRHGMDRYTFCIPSYFPVLTSIRHSISLLFRTLSHPVVLYYCSS